VLQECTRSPLRSALQAADPAPPEVPIPAALTAAERRALLEHHMAQAAHAQQDVEVQMLAALALSSFGMRDASALAGVCTLVGSCVATCYKTVSCR
jgi:hypothetical protein